MGEEKMSAERAIDYRTISLGQEEEFESLKEQNPRRITREEFLKIAAVGGVVTTLLALSLRAEMIIAQSASSMVPDTSRATPSNVPRPGDFIRDERTPTTQKVSEQIQPELPASLKSWRGDFIEKSKGENLPELITIRSDDRSPTFIIQRNDFGKKILLEIVREIGRISKDYGEVFGPSGNIGNVLVAHTERDPFGYDGHDAYFYGPGVIKGGTGGAIFLDPIRIEQRSDLSSTIAKEVAHACTGPGGFPDLPLRIPPNLPIQIHVAGLEKDEVFMTGYAAEESSAWHLPELRKAQRRYPGVFLKFRKYVEMKPGISEPELLEAVGMELAEEGFDGFQKWWQEDAWSDSNLLRPIE